MGMVEKLFGPVDDIPEYYVDAVKFAFNVYDFILELGIQGVKDTPSSEAVPIKPLARIRMSPQHTLILMKLLKKNLDIYQDVVGPISIPDQLYKELDIPKDN